MCNLPVANLRVVPNSTEKLNFFHAVEEIHKQLGSINQSYSRSDLFSVVRTTPGPLLEFQKTLHEETDPVDSSLNHSELN